MAATQELSGGRKVFVVVGLLASVAVLAIVVAPRLKERFGSPSISIEEDDSPAALRQSVEARARIAQDLADLKEELSVAIPSVAPEEQVEQIVAGIEKAAGEAQIKFKSFTPASTGRERRTAGSEVEFDLSFEATHGSLVKFHQSMAQAGLPFAVRELDLDSPGQPDKLNVVMAVSFVLLEPIAKPKSETPEAAPNT